MWRAAALCTVIVTTVGASCAAAEDAATRANAEAEAQRSFTLASDPREKILRLGFASGTSMTYVEYTLYADGRLERVATDPAYPTKRQEVSLSAAQVQALVGQAVGHGLAVTTQAELTAKMRRGWAHDPARRLGTPAIPPPPADASTAEIEVRLASYRGATPVANQLRVEGLDAAAEQLPGVQELQGWTKVLATMKQLLAKGSAS